MLLHKTATFNLCSDGLEKNAHIYNLNILQSFTPSLAQYVADNNMKGKFKCNITYNTFIHRD